MFSLFIFFFSLAGFAKTSACDGFEETFGFLTAEAGLATDFYFRSFFYEVSLTEVKFLVGTLEGSNGLFLQD